MNEMIVTEKAPKAIGPYAQAVAANGFLYISGQIPADPATGALEAPDYALQTRRSMENLEAILAVRGLTFKNVIKTTIFLRDMGKFADVNAVYATFFADYFPARACVEVSRLPKDALVEIEAVAAL